MSHAEIFVFSEGWKAVYSCDLATTNIVTFSNETQGRFAFIVQCKEAEAEIYRSKVPADFGFQDNDRLASEKESMELIKVIGPGVDFETVIHSDVKEDKKIRISFIPGF